MVIISKASYDEIYAFNNNVIKMIGDTYSSLEEVSQKFADAIYENFKDSIVLVRVFATVPFGDLPDTNKKFVTKLATAKRVSSLISDRTLVLSLLGTRGEEPAWNDRHNSKGHVGIPLISVNFIELIPMMSRLLKSLGGSLDWINSNDTKIVSKTLGSLSGLFYIPDAKTTVDEKGRKIIAAQDYVEKYGVKTVFGFGGSYITRKNSVVFIIFTRERIEQKKAESFIILVNILKSITTSIVTKGKIFKV